MGAKRRRLPAALCGRPPAGAIFYRSRRPGHRGGAGNRIGGDSRRVKESNDATS